MNNPFDNLSKVQISKLYDLLQIHIYKFKKNEQILPTIKNKNIVGIITNGSAQTTYVEYNGDEIIVENLKKNDIFGTNISSTNFDTSEIIAKEPTEVLVIDYDKIINPKNIQHNYFNMFLNNLFAITNIKLKERNERIRILQKKQIRDRLLEYFDIEYKKNHLKSFDLPFSLKDLADYIGVNRSAMFRELKHLKDDKFIDIKGKRIILLYK